MSLESVECEVFSIVSLGVIKNNMGRLKMEYFLASS